MEFTDSDPIVKEYSWAFVEPDEPEVVNSVPIEQPKRPAARKPRTQ